MTGTKKAPSPEAWQARGDEAGSQGIASLGQRLGRYGGARQASETMIPQLERVIQSALHASPERAEAEKVLPLLRQCGSFLRFNHYYRVDDLRLVESRSCRKHLLCQFCALRRAAQLLERYLERYRQIASGHVPWLVTWTVRNGPDLAERHDHMRRSWRTLLKRRRNVAKGLRGQSELAKSSAGVYSQETKPGSGGHGWHPHRHALVLVPEGQELDQKRLRAEWEAITGDSFMVDARPALDPENPEADFLEVFKYALKPGELSPAATWAAHLVLKGHRLLGSWGDFRNVPDPDQLDDDPLAGEPYLELVYRWAGDNGYQLQDQTYREADPVPAEPLIRIPGSTNRPSCLYTDRHRAYRDSPLSRAFAKWTAPDP